MFENHLTATDVEAYIENQTTPAARAAVEQHLAACAICRQHIAADRRLDAALRTISREPAPQDLAARIGANVELYQTQEQARRVRIPFLAGAMLFSILLVIWFAAELVVALQENGTVEFMTLLFDRPDLFSAYTVDAILAFAEALPMGELALTLFAILTVIVLMQQLLSSLTPPRMPRHVG